jgi:hypothetical protein
MQTFVQAFYKLDDPPGDISRPPIHLTCKNKLRSYHSASKLYRPTSAAVGEASVDFCGVETVAWSAQRIVAAVNIGFLDWSHYYFLQIDPQLSLRD